MDTQIHLTQHSSTEQCDDDDEGGGGRGGSDDYLGYNRDFMGNDRKPPGENLPFKNDLKRLNWFTCMNPELKAKRFPECI